MDALCTKKIVGSCEIHVKISLRNTVISVFYWPPTCPL